MVIEKDWKAHFQEAFPEWKEDITPRELWEPGTAPRRSFIPWDEAEYRPRRDTITVYVASDMASTRPVQAELALWFTYEAGPIITKYNKNPDVRFRLLMIYGKDDSPDPEQIVPMAGRDRQMTTIETYYRRTLRFAIREAILTKLDATANEVMGLDVVIRRHTTVTCERDRG